MVLPYIILDYDRRVLEVCSGVTNKKEKDGVHERSGRLRSEGPRAIGAPL